MIKTKNYNNLVMKLPAMKPTEVVHFRSLSNGVDESGRPTFASVNVPPSDTIVDEDGSVKEIAIIKSFFSDNKEPTLNGDVFFDRFNSGTITLLGSRASDHNLFEYLKVCNYNASNPNRDASKPAIFEEVSGVAFSSRETSSNKAALAALKYGMETPLADLLRHLSARGYQPAGIGEDEVRNMAVQEYKRNPRTEKDDSAAPVGDTADVSRLAREAIEGGVVTYNAKTGFFELADGTTVGEKLAINVQDKQGKFAAQLAASPAELAKLAKALA